MRGLETLAEGEIRGVGMKELVRVVGEDLVVVSDVVVLEAVAIAVVIAGDGLSKGTPPPIWPPDEMSISLASVPVSVSEVRGRAGMKIEAQSGPISSNGTGRSLHPSPM